MNNNLKTFYNENHERDERGRITKRDYSTFKAIECSNCKKPILCSPAFSHHGKKDMIYGLGKPIDLGNVDYCYDCISKFNEIIHKNK